MRVVVDCAGAAGQVFDSEGIERRVEGVLPEDEG
jgi:hypothetical protein